MTFRWSIAWLALALIPSAAQAKDSLGVFGDWGAFRDANVPRCYAITLPSDPTDKADYRGYASIGTWPDRKLYGQFHIRLSRKVSPASSIRLVIGTKRFELTGGGGDAWAQDQSMDAAINAALRSASDMSVSARDTNGRLFTDKYSLSGAATAMDAATVGCAKRR